MSVLFKALTRSAEDNRSAKGEKPSLLQGRPAVAAAPPERRGTAGGRRRTWRYALLATLLLFVLAATGLAFLPHLWAPLLQTGGDPLLTAARQEPSPVALPPPSRSPSEPQAQPEPAPGQERSGSTSDEEPAAEAVAAEAVREAAEAEEAEAAELAGEAEAADEAVEQSLRDETAMAEAEEVDPFEPPVLNLPPPPGDDGALRPLVPLQQLAQRVLGEQQAASSPGSAESASAGTETGSPAAGQPERIPPAWSGSGGPWQSEAGGGTRTAAAPQGGARRGLVIDAGPPPRPGERDLHAAQQAMAQGAFAAAVPHYEQALRRLPNDSQVEIGLAVALQKSGREDEALAVYSRLLQRDPDNVAALTNFFGLVGGRSPALAIEEMQGLLQRNPQQPAILAQLGMVYARSGDRANALRYLEEAVRLAPDDPVFAMNLAVLNDQLGRRDEAIDNYRRVLRLSESGAAGEIPVASVRERLRYLYGN